MSDQNEAPATQEGEGEAQEGEGQREFLTREEAQKLAKDAEETAFRRAQSYFDKAQGSVREKLNALEDAWKIQEAAGITIDEETRSKARAQVAQQASVESLAQPTEKPTEQSQAKDARQVGGYDPVLEIVLRMQAEAGVEITDEDPEVKMLDNSSAFALVSSLPKAIAAKKARIGTSEGEGEQEPRHITGIGQGTSANPIASMTSPDDLFREYKRAKRRG